MINPVDGGSKPADDVAKDSGNVAKNGEGQPAHDEGEQQQQDQIINDKSQPTNQKSPQSDDHIEMDHGFESSNGEDISARPGGLSLGPESSTSKISAAAGIPEYLLQGLDVSTPEEALVKLLSGGALTLTVKVHRLLRRMTGNHKLNKNSGKQNSKKSSFNMMCWMLSTGTLMLTLA
jgi:hypothetical protein